MAKKENKKIPETKNRPKNLEEKPAAGSPAPGQPAENQPQAKKGKTCLTCGIIAVVAVVVLVIGLIGFQMLSFWFSPYGLFGIFSKFAGIEKISQTALPGSGNTFSGKKQPVANMAKAVKKMITAKDGGMVEVTSENGMTTTLIIPPESLEENTEIIIAPNESDPDDENGSDEPEDPGVTVGPPGTTFDPPATISFSFIPSQTAANVVPGTGQSGNSQNRNGSSERDESRDSNRRFPNSAVIVFTNNGSASPVPTNREDNGATISGSIGGSGAAEPENPTEDEAEDMVDSAAATGGGACTGEYIEALARMVAVASANGNSAATARYESEIRRCNDESLDHLRRLCENNPIQLRRKDFQNRLALAQALPASSGTASEIERLMNECQARYHFHGEGIHPSSGSGVILFASLDASVCGYLDDQWTGSQYFREGTEYQNTAYVFEGTSQFSLPKNAGAFSGTTRGSNNLTVSGIGVGTPQLDFGFDGYFDGSSTIQTLNLYPPGTTISGTPIELQEKPCVPLAPLPGNPSN
jgi:hypothetical protein